MNISKVLAGPARRLAIISFGQLAPEGKGTADSMAAGDTVADHSAVALVDSRMDCTHWAFAESKDCRPDMAAYLAGLCCFE